MFKWTIPEWLGRMLDRLPVLRFSPYERPLTFSEIWNPGIAILNISLVLLPGNGAWWMNVVAAMVGVAGMFATPRYRWVFKPKLRGSMVVIRNQKVQPILGNKSPSAHDYTDTLFNIFKESNFCYHQVTHTGDYHNMKLNFTVWGSSADLVKFKLTNSDILEFI